MTQYVYDLARSIVAALTATLTERQYFDLVQLELSAPDHNQANIAEFCDVEKLESSALDLLATSFGGIHPSFPLDSSFKKAWAFLRKNSYFVNPSVVIPIVVKGAMSDGHFPCFSTGAKYNGYEIPYFTRNVADEVAAAMGNAAYDAIRDEFVIDFEGSSSVIEPVWVAYEGRLVKTYPLGATTWSWAGEPRPNVSSGRFCSQWVPVAPPPIKVFAAYWDPGTFENPGTGLHDDTSFSTYTCYGSEEVSEIQHMQVGQRWKSHHYGAAHTVTRVL